MLSETLQEGLKEYAIGEKLRALRLKKKMGLVELGQHTGLSPALLSKIERGRLFPTLPTLLRIALVFSVGLEYFFTGPRDRPLVAVVRKAERVRLPDRQDAASVAYRFESLDYRATERRFNAFYAEFLPVPPEARRRHDHPGVEFIFIVTGTLLLQIGERDETLRAGDAIYFDATIPHGYSRAGRPPCTALVVTTS